MTPYRSDDGLTDCVELAESVNDGNSTVLIRVWSDGTCDLEQYANVGEDLDEYGTRRQLLRATCESVPIAELGRGVEALAAEEFFETVTRTPQDTRRLIEDLEAKAERVRAWTRRWKRSAHTWRVKATLLDGALTARNRHVADLEALASQLVLYVRRAARELDPKLARGLLEDLERELMDAGVEATDGYI